MALHSCLISHKCNACCLTIHIIDPSSSSSSTILVNKNKCVRVCYAQETVSIEDWSQEMIRSSCHVQSELGPRGCRKRKITEASQDEPALVHGTNRALETSENTEPRLKLCRNLQMILLQQFSEMIGVAPGGGPSSFIVDIGNVPIEAFEILVGQKFGAYLSCQRSSISIRHSTLRLLGVSDLNQMKKPLLGTFLRPSPSCALQYSPAEMHLRVCAYSEFIY